MSRCKVFQLKCYSQHNIWGKVGSDSTVAQLLKSSDPTYHVVEDKPYAELWMGTHPTGPSIIVIPGEAEKKLTDWLLEHPEAIGEDDIVQGSLTFMMKVLSIKKALSLQAHPNKKLAEKLHIRDPETYRDSNHKPELVIALTDFVGICGFRPIAEVAQFVQDIEELRDVIGADNADILINASISDDIRRHQEAMKSSFTALLRKETTNVKSNLKKLVERVKSLETHGQDTKAYIGDVLLKLDDEYPGDVGGFSIYFMNIIKMKRGDAIYINAGLPHAYLSGDCVECLSCSDNIVRAGLTAKYRDIDTLVGMLDYRGRTEEDTKLIPTEYVENGCTLRRFTVPIKEFAVTQVQIPRGIVETKLSAMTSASIFICIEGRATLNNVTLARPIEVGRGKVIFISANEAVQLKLDGADGMLLFRAHSRL